MSFNKNAVKRFAKVANINRVCKDMTDIVNKCAREYLSLLVYRLKCMSEFCNRKTILVEDIMFIHVLNPEYPKLCVYKNSAGKFKMYTSDLQKEYTLLTLRKPCETAIREMVENDFRFGKNVLAILQHLVEQYIITIFRQAARFMRASDRETLLDRDIKAALAI